MKLTGMLLALALSALVIGSTVAQAQFYGPGYRVDTYGPLGFHWNTRVYSAPVVGAPVYAAPYCAAPVAPVVVPRPVFVPRPVYVAPVNPYCGW